MHQGRKGGYTPIQPLMGPFRSGSRFIRPYGVGSNNVIESDARRAIEVLLKTLLLARKNQTVLVRVRYNSGV